MRNKRFVLSQRRKNSRGFSLVEVVLALGILVFCLVALLGLIPSGLQSFRAAMTLTVESQIAQSISGDLQLTDFTNLKTMLATDVERHYDDQGIEVESGSPLTVYTATISLNDLVSPANLPPEAIRNVQIRIVNKTTPTRESMYSVIVVNNNR